MREIVAVTGGSGGIGQALLEQLVSRYDVKALFRTRTALSDQWAARGCTAVWGDLGDARALSELVAGATFVFHCAAQQRGSYEASYAVNVEGTRRLARVAAAHDCRRFVHISSIAVYGGTTNHAEYAEDTELREYDDLAVYSLTKLQSENAVRQVARQDGLEFTILRPTCVYGPNTKPFTLIPMDLIRKRLPVIVGDGRSLLDVVYVDDVAKALLLAAECPQAAGEVFNIGHERVTTRDFYAHYGQMLNRPVRALSTSAIDTIVELLRLVPGRRQATQTELRNAARYMIRMAENTKPFPSTKAAATFGYAPQVGLTVGMLKTELWAKQTGFLRATRYSLPAYGPLDFRPAALARPRTEEEITEIAQTARFRSLTVRAIGALHSPCPIPETDGICLVLDEYDSLVRVEGPLVTVQAGMRLSDLNEALAELNLALPVSGSITAQTVAGAISTATHGGSFHYGSLSDYVEAVRIVKADGSVVEIDRSSDLLPAVAVSLGLLGVISTVTLRCVSAFALRSRGWVQKAPQVIEDFDRIHRDNLYVDMLYFPITDDFEVLCVNRIEHGDDSRLGNERREPDGRPGYRPSTAPRNGIGRRLGILGLTAAAQVLHHSRAHRLREALAKRSVGSSYPARTGRSDFVLAFREPQPAGRAMVAVPNMEVAIPYEEARAGLRVLRQHFATSRRYPLLPVHIRCSPRSDLWLSPAYQRDVCWIEFWQYPRSAAVFRTYHELLAPFGYRFHWGKETAADGEYIKQQYERWGDFVRLRDEWDPGGVFANRYLESFFGR